MESRAHALAAGLFVLLFGVAVAATVWWLSGKRELTKDYILVSRGSVTGLNPQAQVRFRGIRAGKVIGIELDPLDRRNILVAIRIDDDIPVTESTRAELNFQGVTGLAYVQLTDSGESDKLLVERDGSPPRIELRPSQLQELADAAAAMVGQARNLVGRLNELLDETNVKRIGRTLGNLEQTSAGINEAVRELPELVASARRFVGEDNARRVQAILANVERTTSESAALAAEMRVLVRDLQALSKRLETVAAAGGELGATTLPRMSRLLTELARTSRQLKRALDDLETQPEAVIFGKATRPGPGEAGFDPEER